jgi:ubiquinol-cytochrome c reductase cytochrome b subunit
MVGSADGAVGLVRLEDALGREEWRKHAAEYYAPKNFNFWYYFGSLAMLVLGIQIITGHLPHDALQAGRQPRVRLGRIHHARRVGRLDHPLHPLDRRLGILSSSSTCTCSAACCYGSYKRPRELVWIFGVLIYLTLMGEAFFGYLLPWGQMSYWGAQVIVNLFGTVPLIGPDLALWIRGDYVVGDATLNRFFALHVIAFPAGAARASSSRTSCAA